MPTEQGTVSIDETNSTITFTPAENFNGDATITLVTTDNNGATATKTSVINVTAVNDAPILSGSSEILFYDSFETPDVTGENSTNPPGWINTSNPNYVQHVDEDSEKFTTPFGEQAILVYRGSTIGATTDANILNATLEADTFYNLSFNVARAGDLGNYVVQLLAIDDDNSETILSSVTGTATKTDFSDSNNLTYEYNDLNSDLLGDRLAIRLMHNPDLTLDYHYSVYFDNVQLSKNTATYVENGDAVILNDKITVADVELDFGSTGNYSGATLNIVRGVGANSEDVLSFSDGNGITLSEDGHSLIKNEAIIATFDTRTIDGELNINFTDSNGESPTSADVNNILSQITYANSSDAPSSNVQLDWTFSDGNSGVQGSGEALQATGISIVNITAVNDAPVITGDSIGAVTEDVIGAVVDGSSNLSYTGTLNIVDVDTDESVFQTASVTASTGSLGNLIITAEGKWTYKVDNSAVQYLGEGATKVETFTVLSADGTEHEVQITITGSNDAPELVVTDLAANEDGNAISDTPTFTDVDSNDGHTYTVSSMADGQGYVEIDSATGKYTFNPGTDFQSLAAGETTTVSFDVTIDDGQGGTSTKTVTVNITGSNDNPTITAITGSVQTENLAKEGDDVASFSASDVDSKTITYSITSGNTNNYFEINTSTGIVTLTAAGEAVLANESLVDTTYRLGVTATDVTATDGTANSAEATATIVFDGINDAPTNAEFGRYLSQLTPISQSNITGGAKFDTDYSGNPISLSSIDYDYGVMTHAAITGVASIDYNIDGATRFVATIGIEDSSGANGDVIFRVLVDGVEQYNSGQVNYVDDAIEISVDVTDGAVLQLEVSNADGNRYQDHAVWANARLEGGTAASASINENTSNGTVVGFVTGNDIDSPDSFSYSLTNSADGRFAIDSTGKIIVADSSLLDYETNTFNSIEVKVTDTEGASTAQKLTISLNNVNEAAVITGADTRVVTEDILVIENNISTSGSLTIVDQDTGESSFQIDTVNGAYGDLTIDAEGHWTYTADNTHAEIQQLAEGESLTETLTVTSVGGTTHDVLITINGSDDLAVISGTTLGDVQEDGMLTSLGTLTINDVDTSDSTQFVDVTATAVGTAAHYVAKDSGGNPERNGTVGTSGTDMILNNEVF